MRLSGFLLLSAVVEKFLLQKKKLSLDIHLPFKVFPSVQLTRNLRTFCFRGKKKKLVATTATPNSG